MFDTIFGLPMHPLVVHATVVIALAASIGTTVQVARIGHSGAQAAWRGVK